MKIVNVISELEAAFGNITVESLKNEDPEKLSQITKLFNNLTELAIHIMRKSPEFRTQFAKIHSEFLKYPECRQVIDSSINAIKQYNPDLVKN